MATTKKNGRRYAPLADQVGRAPRPAPRLLGPVLPGEVVRDMARPRAPRPAKKGGR